MRRPHPNPGLRLLGVVQVLACTVGVLSWLLMGYAAAFCGDGVPNSAACHDVRVQWRVPAVALALAGGASVVTLLRARKVDTRRERLALMAAALVTLVVAASVLAWYWHLLVRTGSS